jgi:ribose transport system substrate-binding protein
LGGQVVVERYIGHGFRESQELAAEALSGYRGRLDAVFAPNESTAYGTLQAIAAMPAETRRLLVAFDWHPEFLEAIQQGTLYATVVQDAYGMGYRAVETLVAATKGLAPPAVVSVAVMTVTLANLDDAKVQALLAHYRD